MGTLAEIIALVKGLPESYLQRTLEKVKEIREEADSEVDETQTTCPHCQSAAIVRNGKKRGKQQ
jgi:transposase-like protein